MVLNEINHKMPIYRDCTLGEIILVGAMSLFIPLIILTVLCKLIFGFGFIGTSIAFISFYPLTKIMLTRLQKIKYGKPYAYFKHRLIKQLIEYGFYKKLFITKHQKWSVVSKQK